jgi:O-antigen/teichoic acid export membrane protein
MLSYGMPLIIVGLAGMVNETLDRILLKHMLPFDLETNLQQVGIYSAVYKIAIFMTLVIQAFRMGAEPFFFRQAGKRDAKDVYASVMKYFVIVCCFIFLGVTLYIDIFKYIIGPRYHAGLGVVPILLMANLFLGIFYNLSVWYKLTDNTIYATWISVSGALITLVLNYLLIPHIGYYGSAWATLCCYFSITLLSYFIGRKFYPVQYHIVRIALYLFISVALYGVFSFVTYQFDISTPLNYIAATALIILFSACVYLFERAELSDLLKPDKQSASQ